jgi:hypothetical protein
MSSALIRIGVGIVALKVGKHGIVTSGIRAFLKISFPFHRSLLGLHYVYYV